MLGLIFFKMGSERGKARWSFEPLTDQNTDDFLLFDNGKALLALSLLIGAVYGKKSVLEQLIA